MATDGQPEIERPNLSVVGGGGNIEQPALTDSAEKPQLDRRVQRGSKTTSKSIAKGRKDDAVVLANQLAISQRQVRELHEALAEFRAILTTLVQESEVGNDLVARFN
jgi:hypothetical protein